MSPPPAHLPTEADLASVLRASTRRRVLLTVAALVALATLAFVAARKGPAITAWFRGETDLRGRRRYHPARPPDRAALARIRFDRVHGELLPHWLIAVQREKTFDDRDRAEEALARLRLAIEPDPNLDAITLELDARIREDLAGNSARVRYLLWAWSAYLDSAGVPYRVEGSVVHPRRSPAKLHFRVYRVLDDARVGVGAQRYRARLLRRVDRTNLIEADLGHTSDADEGALVVVDTVFNFAVDDVWPLLDANDDPQRPPMQRAHAAFVRIEAARALPREDLARLTATAHARFAMLQAAASINARAWCESALYIQRVPWRGYSLELVRAARAVARETPEDPDCPPLLPEEADDFAAGSAVMRETAGLDHALASLVVWVSRAVVVHEARHAADDREADGLRSEMRCAHCPPWLRTSGRAELSAYLASFATPGIGHLSYFQACRAAGVGMGPHVDALTVASESLHRGGCLAPPGGLYTRAGRLERELLGHTSAVTLPPAPPVERFMP